VVKEQCEKYDSVAFFFKQWGAWGSDGVKRNKKENGRVLDGKIYDEYPEFIDEN
jgi:protein gp37